MTTKEKTYASEAGHWYTEKGETAYEVPYADPKRGTRPTTLRDARKLNLCPSTTGIIGVADKPALTAWKVRQAFLAALTLPKNEGESLDDFAKRAAQDAKEEAQAASELGSRIHGAIEDALMGAAIDVEAFGPHVDNTLAILRDLQGENLSVWNTETPFAHPLGYGGKIDLWTAGYVIDLKTKDFDEDVDVAKSLAWPEQCMQLAAYAAGLGADGGNGPGGTWPTLVNIYIDRKTGLTRWHIWKKDQVEVAWAKFRCLLTYWQLDKNYIPSWAEVSK
jgi:hypothetical protein